ncbi:MAG: hypothetical protein ABT20_02790 [Rubrivivax sp. SCN 70-15]|nr:MAG: hypothetical protein ABT20_02790 [Rubrivivax sp. SCN 70-15]
MRLGFATWLSIFSAFAGELRFFVLDPSRPTMLWGCIQTIKKALQNVPRVVEGLAVIRAPVCRPLRGFIVVLERMRPLAR